MAQDKKSEPGTIDRELRRTGAMLAAVLAVAILWKTGVLNFMAGCLVNYSLSTAKRIGEEQKEKAQAARKQQE